MLFALHHFDLTGDEAPQVVNPDVVITGIGDVEKGMADQFLLCPPKDPTKGVAYPLKATVEADDGHADRRIGEDSREIPFALAHAGEPRRELATGRPADASRAR
jgi:hypothetical protein